MSIREEFEKREKSFVSPCGCLSAQSRGRVKKEPLCPIRTVFQQDRDRIVYSNAFRRLKQKTQVFLAPLGLGDHYRTRLTHTLEVSETARTIARALRLNEDLVEAISLGHDLGHTPFGHSGETVLQEIYSRHFSHQKQSLRVVDKLENKGEGLNLTYEVRDGILKHAKGYGSIISSKPGEMAVTLEGRIVRVSDIIAYLNHDLDDAIRSGVIRREQIPTSIVTTLGRNHSERATTMIHDLIYSSQGPNGSVTLTMSDAIYTEMCRLREFLYTEVYRSPRVHNQFVKAKKILSDLYYYFLEEESCLREELAKMEMDKRPLDFQPKERVVCDFIASMTDRYALDLYEKIFFPTPQV
ncbi:MAG: deoxyguanosinetriphosphate triphosphohydrolase [Desulfobacterales bacterium]|jgi:dGTPase|nr:deoxyguanosinetriphosphate triphosphohydrolase [Desulfobacterales bacterium]